MTGFELSSPSGAIHSVSTDSEIIQRSLGQPRAFAELFDRHARTVGGYAARRLGPDAGEDILSETFLVAFARRKSFDTAWELALPWLYGIASRLIKKHRTREAKHLRSSAAAAAREEHISHGDLDVTVARLDAEISTRELAPMIASLSAKVARPCCCMPGGISPMKRSPSLSGSRWGPSDRASTECGRD